MMIKLQPKAVWAMAEELPHTVHAGTEPAAHVDEMASDETLIRWVTSDPTVRELCDLWEIPYEVSL